MTPHVCISLYFHSTLNVRKAPVHFDPFVQCHIAIRLFSINLEISGNSYDRQARKPSYLDSNILKDVLIIRFFLKYDQ